MSLAVCSHSLLNTWAKTAWLLCSKSGVLLMAIPPRWGAQTGMDCQNTGSSKVLAAEMEYSGMTWKVWKEEDTQMSRAPRTCNGLWLQHNGPGSSQEPAVSLSRSLYLAAPGSLLSPSLLMEYIHSFFPKLAFPKNHSRPL